MKVSEVTIADLKQYAHVYHAEDDALFTTILTACKAYIQGYTGLTADAMNSREELTVALFVLANELYDNRSFTVQDNKVNRVAKSILDMHVTNLV
ncbi:head-tail connector protein [Ectobacillus ponti]|uniref:Head-tail connector protein n=1 Tax=Ectobacillus ponti TaxID=2961894 RepID=A0AA41XB56_9BACI|nr:head-tail connector protein [Ectobacillus ponti]MCP8969720.1 head-tail connector protein [Ectobacillus ponti]